MSGGGLAIDLTSLGMITGVTFAGKKVRRPMRGGTFLAECELSGRVVSTKLQNGGVEFRKALYFDRGYRSCALVERFVPAPMSVRWEIEIQGDGEPWTTAINTHLQWPETSSAKFWTSWGDSYALPVTDAVDASGRGWVDPTVPQAFRDMKLWYGDNFRSGAAFSVPLATVLDPSDDLGLSLALSPEDTILDMTLETDDTGSIVFARLHNKISKGNSVRFAMDLFSHQADWRSALAWMVDHYPAFFNPANSAADEISGPGAYSSHTGELDVQKLKRMGFKVNWLASFDFPYMGMFIPPLPKGNEWSSWYHKVTSTGQINDYCRKMREVGFHVLCYFNVTEFGSQIKFPPPVLSAANDGDLWRDANAFLYKKLGNSILLGEDGQPLRTWDEAVVVDPGDSACQDFWVEQAQKHVEEIVDAAGICIDRLDWLTQFNYRADDGASWVNVGVGQFNGRPVRCLTTSWNEVMRRIGPVLHRSGKAIFVNTLMKRLDLMREVDGIFDEFGFYGFNLNLDSFLGARKPVIAWTSDHKELQLQPDPDAYLQRHLFMGAFPMVPYPGNDHSILPEARAERFYTDYGPLFDELQGRKWALLPHVIQVEGHAAKANIFETPRGFVVPVTFGGKALDATIVLRGVPVVASPRAYHFEVLHPGSSTRTVAKSIHKEANKLAITVPLSRGCAVLRMTR